MPPEKNPDGSDGEVVTFEELPDLNTGGEGGEGGGDGTVQGAVTREPKDQKCPPGYEYDPKKKTCVKVKKEAEGPDEVIPVSAGVQFARYPKGSKTYKCPPGYAFDPKKAKCIKVKKGAEGPAECDLVEIISGEPVKPLSTEPIEGQEGNGDKGPYTCPPGEVYDDKKKKCVPVKQALDERDAEISQLRTTVNNVTDALRMKKIEGTVDEQVAGGHLAPVQRDKAISFLSGLPDDQHESLLGIWEHQKFPLGEEGGTQATKLPTEVGIGESESAEGLTNEAKAFIMKTHGIRSLVKERGIEEAN